MSDFIRVTLDDLEFQRFAVDFPRAIYNAQRSAQRKTATWAKKRIEKKLSDKYQIPLKTLKQYRIHKKEKPFFSKVTTGWNPILAKQKSDNSFLGKLEQVSGGALAGNQYFENGFVATMRNSGVTGVFKHTGQLTRNNKPQIKMESMNMTLTPQEISAEEPAIAQNLKENFETKIQEYIERGVIVDDRQTE